MLPQRQHLHKELAWCTWTQAYQLGEVMSSNLSGLVLTGVEMPQVVVLEIAVSALTVSSLL